MKIPQPTPHRNSPPALSSPLGSLCENSIFLSFRGAEVDEESRTDLKTLRARFLASLGMTAEWRFPHILLGRGKRGRGEREKRDFKSSQEFQESRSRGVRDQVLAVSTAKSREQSQNVYENKGQVQNVAESGSADRRFCGLRLFHGRWRQPRTANTAVRATGNRGNKARMLMKTKNKYKMSLSPGVPDRTRVCSGNPLWLP